MSFKIKNRKKKTVDNRTTIDAKHNSIIKKFKEDKKQCPAYKKELIKCRKSLDKLMEKSMKEFSDEDFELKDSLEDRIEFLEKKIYDLENSVEEKKYYLETSNLLFDYYDISLSSKKVMKKVKKIAVKKQSWIGLTKPN